MLSAASIKKKRQRNGSAIRRASAFSMPDSSSGCEALIESSQRRRLLNNYPRLGSKTHLSSLVCKRGFNDSATSDVILRLHFNPDPSPFVSLSESDAHALTEEDVLIHLHSEVLHRSKYFAAQLSDRWKRNSPDDDDRKLHSLSFGVSAAPTGTIAPYLTVLQLLYCSDLSETIDSASLALEILPVALEILFEDCVKACVRFLEAVPWSEEEEKKVLKMVPLLREEESRELLSRVSPVNGETSEEMLHGLILTTMHNHPNVAFVKAFVAKLLRDFSSKDSARRVLDRAFNTSLKIVKESLEEYSSPNFRGTHIETEVIQKLNLQTAVTNGKHLLWLLERMIELKVADMAVSAWSEQSSLTGDLQRAFHDDAWRNIVPGLPGVILRCTSRIAGAVASGSVLVHRQVRKKLVHDWLPVLIVCKEKVSAINNPNSIYVELEETFLRIVSTLPMPDAQELLQQCLCFSTRNVEDCPHLITAFNTWFRRATYYSTFPY